MNEKIRSLLHSFNTYLLDLLWSFAIVCVHGILYGLRRRARKRLEGLQETEIEGEGDMEKEIQIGTEGKVDVKLAAGKIYLIGSYDGVDLDAKLELGIEVDILLDKLAEKIPGKIDDSVIQLLKAALKVL